MYFQADGKIIFSSELSRESIAVLSSGGIESAALVGQLGRHFKNIYPVYVRFGFSWETAEEQHLRHYLSRLKDSHINQLTVLSQPLSDIYSKHWSVSGKNVPSAGSDDETVFLPGRNLFLLSKAAAWCSLHGIPTIALGSLKTNPFTDGSQSFMQLLQSVFATSFGHNIEIVRPFAQLEKTQVLQISAHLPLESSFSCINPVRRANVYLHCQRCNKCGERQHAFARARIEDKTTYVQSGIAAARSIK